QKRGRKRKSRFLELLSQRSISGHNSFPDERPFRYRDFLSCHWAVRQSAIRTCRAEVRRRRNPPVLRSSAEGGQSAIAQSDSPLEPALGSSVPTEAADWHRIDEFVGENNAADPIRIERGQRIKPAHLVGKILQ